MENKMSKVDYNSSYAVIDTENNTLLSSFRLADQEGLIEQRINRAKHQAKKCKDNWLLMDTSRSLEVLAVVRLPNGGFEYIQ
jgi:hypothetical protein